MKKHTPGPWKIDDAEDLPLGVIQDDEDGQGICEMQGELFTRETATPEQWANAHLIAAAPDLLEALEKLMEDVGNAGTDYYSCSLDCQTGLTMAINAIAKAKGETQ